MQSILKRCKLKTRFAFIGKTQSGKSWLCKRFQEFYPRKIIIDTKKEYNNPNAGYHVTGFEQFCEAYRRLPDFDQYTIIFKFHEDEMNRKEIFVEICRLVFKLKDVMFVVEEIHLVCPVRFDNHWMMEIATVGAEDDIGYMVTTQRPALINKTILTQCDHVFIASLIDESDIRYCRTFLGNYAKLITGFAERNFAYWSVGGETGVVKT